MKSPGDDAWLETIAARATAMGCERPNQTIAPERSPRSSDVETLSRELADASSAGVELSDTLGRGGMAIVHLGRQLRLDRLVAVKTLRADRDPALAIELVREAQVTGGLEHPNIVPIHDIVSDDRGQPRVVMKRIAGSSWADRLVAADREPAGDLDQLRGDIEILIQVANAVRFAHAQGYVHRDLKPANVMIGSFGEVYVVDWGLAVEPGASPAMAGTPAYMAPEMLGGEGARVDERSDVYLLGGVLLEIASGQVPHPGAQLLEVLEHVRDGEVAIGGELPDELAALCRKALARDPDDRLGSVDELVAGLRAFLEHLGSTTLALEAARSLARLRELLAGEPDRQQVYNLFGECRFGFRAALAAWPDNRAARDGLNEALEVVVEHELARGDDGAASALLAEHPDPPAALETRVDSAAGARADRERRLEHLESNLDPTIGQVPRMLATVGLCLFAVGLPLAITLVDIESRLTRSGFHSLGLTIWIGVTALLVGLVAVSRRRLLATHFNRVIVVGVLIGSAASTATFALGLVLSLDPIALPILIIVVWGVIAAMLAIAVEPRVWVIAGAYGAAFVVAVIDPGLRYLALVAANTIAATSEIYAWRVSARSRPRDQLGRSLQASATPSAAPTASASPSYTSEKRPGTND